MEEITYNSCSDCDTEITICTGCGKKFNKGNRVFHVDGMETEDTHFHSKSCFIRSEIKTLKECDYATVV